MFFINRKGFIYYAKRLKINDSDQNILKDSAFYAPYLKDFLLADRGFQNKRVREHIQNIYGCRFISPYLKKQKETLTKKEWKLYRKRWGSETVFQRVKSNYAEVSLILKEKYTENLKNAKFYAASLLYNALRS